MVEEGNYKITKCAGELANWRKGEISRKQRVWLEGVALNGKKD